MRRLVVQIVARLREAGVRISPAEVIDAMRAVAAAGFERERLREAMAAALIKCEDDRPIFERVFASVIGALSSSPQRNAISQTGVSGSSARPNEVEGTRIRRPLEPRFKSSGPSERLVKPHIQPELAADDSRDGDQHRESEQNESDGPTSAERMATERSWLKAVERLPFSQYSQLEYEQARNALAPLIRRFRVRAGRRLRAARRGRLDFRRTIRESIQHGGAMSELFMRGRRPRRVDLVIMADISGSVRYAATLMLELTAGVQELFHRASSFVFIDRLAEASFEQGHLVSTPVLDLYARSDFGRVLAKLRENYGHLLGPATVLIILGDGRNNRRPARVDLLAEIARRCRAVCWFNPETLDRWGRGDSAIWQYARYLDLLIQASSLRELESALGDLLRLRAVSRHRNLTRQYV